MTQRLATERDDRFNVVTSNLAGNTVGGRDRHAAIRWLLGQSDPQPDVVLAQECPSIDEEVTDALEQSGRWQVLWSPAWSGGRWGTAVFARETLNAQRIKVEDRWSDWLRIVAATISVEGIGPVTVASAHPWYGKFDRALDPGGRVTKAARLPMAQHVCTCDVAWVVLDELRKHTALPFIIGGDWNTGRLFDVTSNLDPGTGQGFFDPEPKRPAGTTSTTSRSGTKSRPGTEARTMRINWTICSLMYDSRTGALLASSTVALQPAGLS